MGKKATTSKDQYQDKAIVANAKVNAEQTAAIEANKKSLKKLEENAEKDFEAQKQKDVDQDNALNLNGAYDRLRYADLEKKINKRFAISLILNVITFIVAITVALH